MNENFVINIGRQLGSGGHEVGLLLAAALKIDFYDKELIEMASEKSGLAKGLFEKMDEKTGRSMIHGIFSMHSGVNNEVYAGNYLCNETLFKIQSDVIRELAEKKSCLFVGRCADYILRDNERVVNVFIAADPSDRVKRVMQKQGLTAEKAEELIEKTDKKRSGYYNFFSNKVWGAAESYHLCINTSALGIEGTVNLVRHFVEEKLKLKAG